MYPASIVQVLRDPGSPAIAVVELSHGNGGDAWTEEAGEAPMGELLNLMHGDASCRAIVVSAAGGRGADAGFVGAASVGAGAWPHERTNAHVRRTAKVLEVLADASKPVLLAIEGEAADDLLAWVALATEVIAAKDVRFRVSSLRQGGWPGYALQWGLARRVGGARARELLLTGRAVASDEAIRLGLVDALVEPGDARRVACLRARDYVAAPPLPVASIGRALARHGAGLDDAIAVELDAQPLLRGSNDHAEAVAAFVARRSPVFTGS